MTGIVNELNLIEKPPKLGHDLWFDFRTTNKAYIVGKEGNSVVFISETVIGKR